MDILRNDSGTLGISKFNIQLTTKKLGHFGIICYFSKMHRYPAPLIAWRNEGASGWNRF